MSLRLVEALHLESVALDIADIEQQAVDNYERPHGVQAHAPALPPSDKINNTQMRPQTAPPTQIPLDLPFITTR